MKRFIAVIMMAVVLLAAGTTPAHASAHSGISNDGLHLYGDVITWLVPFAWVMSIVLLVVCLHVRRQCRGVALVAPAQNEGRTFAVLQAVTLIAATLAVANWDSAVLFLTSGTVAMVAATWTLAFLLVRTHALQLLRDEALARS